MRIVPVLDLMEGIVVRGVGGRREEYRPIISRLTSSSDLLVLAEVFREQFGFGELYLADLDAILGGQPGLHLYRELCRRDFTLWVDAGLRDCDRVKPLLDSGVRHPVAGLETLAAPEVLARLLDLCGERLVFSLDLKAGLPLTSSMAWPKDPWDIAQVAIALGVTRFLVLDLAQVGEGRGTGTEAFCHRLTAEYPHLEVSAGGGVRGVEDLRRLRTCGVKATLVASALHDGRLTRELLDEFK